jgi:hypothetical protein
MESMLDVGKDWAGGKRKSRFLAVPMDAIGTLGMTVCGGGSGIGKNPRSKNEHGAREIFQGRRARSFCRISSLWRISMQAICP